MGSKAQRTFETFRMRGLRSLVPRWAARAGFWGAAELRLPQKTAGRAYQQGGQPGDQTQLNLI